MADGHMGGPTFINKAIPDIFGRCSVEFGSVWDQFGASLGSIWDQLRSRFEVGLGRLWDGCGVSLGSFRGQLGVGLASVSNTFRINRSSSWGPCGVGLGESGQRFQNAIVGNRKSHEPKNVFMFACFADVVVVVVVVRC